MEQPTKRARLPDRRASRSPSLARPRWPSTPAAGGQQPTEQGRSISWTAILQMLTVFIGKIGHLRTLAALQGPDIRRDGPTLRRRDTVGVAVHGALAVGDH